MFNAHTDTTKESQMKSQREMVILSLLMRPDAKGGKKS